MKTTTMNRTTDMEKVKELALQRIPDRSWLEIDFTPIRRLINMQTSPVGVFETFDGLYDYIYPSPKPICNKLSLLIDMESALSLEDMRIAMLYVWTTCTSDINGLHGADAKAILRMLRDCNQSGWGLMDYMEYTTYCDLPEELTIYRRLFLDDGRRSKFLSWTIDLKHIIRHDCSSRFGSKDASTICKAKIKKKDVLTYFAKDSEVIVNPDKVFDIEFCSTFTYRKIEDELTELKNNYSGDVVEAIYSRNLEHSCDYEDMQVAVDVTRNILEESCNMETAQLIGSYKSNLPTDNCFYFEEYLYQQDNGEFFLVGEGGAMSKYHFITRSGFPTGCRRRIPITQSEANVWIALNLV